METFICVISSLAIAIAMVVFPTQAQFNSEINPEYFKKIKVKKLSFLFGGIGGKHSIHGDVKNYGVVVPMFVMQVVGYCLSIFSLILSFVLYFIAHVNVRFIILLLGVMALAELVALATVEIVCSIISKRHKDE